MFLYVVFSTVGGLGHGSERPSNIVLCIRFCLLVGDGLFVNVFYSLLRV